MKKIVLVIGLFFLLVSCQSMSAPESTATPIPTNTIIPPTTTNTVEPTSTPVPPTLTPIPTLVNIDFEMPVAFAPFETQFPLTKINQFDGYLLRCALDGVNFHIGQINLDTNIEMRAWTACYFKTPDNRIDFVNVPLYIVRPETGLQFVTLSQEPQHLPGGQIGYIGFSLKALEKVIPSGIKIVTGNNGKKSFVFGVGFGTPSSADISQNYMSPLVSKYLSNIAIEKLSNGDTSGLQTVDGIEHFLPAIEYLVDMANK
jgi:hypothetical protein